LSTSVSLRVLEIEFSNALVRSRFNAILQGGGMTKHMFITAGREVELGTPTPLFEVARNLNDRWYAVSPDGRFLTNTTPPSAHTRRFDFVLNWPAELNK
jgi:hypothetical protein